jgi:glycosyltransferase involved in cell wall biosynthesis
LSEKTKLLWHSNAPTTKTGYGAQTALFLERLKDHYELAASAFYGVEGAVIPWKSIPMLPGIGNTYGNECILEHANMFFGGEPRGGLTVTLMDVWVLDPAIWSQLDLACWVPVDHEPAPDPVVGFFKQSGAIPIAMSRFGQKMLQDRDLDPLYVPHGIDTKAYRPHDQAEARESLGMDPDTYVVGMVAANKGNPSRKCFAEALEAFKIFHSRHEEARLYLHTEATGRFGGVDLPALIHRLGIDPSTVIFTDQYRAVHFPHTDERMGEVFSTFDVLLSPSAGEGFGIPVIEAQACGVPVIVSDFSAQPELVGAGWLVEGTRTYTGIGSWQVKPSVVDIFESLESCYKRDEKQIANAAKQARAKALEYDVDTVFADYMLPALAEVQKRLDARKPQTLKAAA